MARSDRNEVSCGNTPWHLILFYALTTVIRIPGAASLQTYWVVIGLYVDLFFIFILVYRLSISWFYMHEPGFSHRTMTRIKTGHFYWFVN